LLLLLILILGGVIENDQEQDHDQEQESRLLIFNELQNTSSQALSPRKERLIFHDLSLTVPLTQVSRSKGDLVHADVFKR
jgi:hypothetical protein